MTNLSFGEAAPLISEYVEKMKSLRPEPVFFYPYLTRVLEERWDKLQPQFPMDIKIPKENKYLLKGDFDPEYVIHLDEPIRREDGTPMWFENSSDEVFLRFGYTNCDARYICDQKMNMEFIHAFLGGSSGHGKSVTLNSMLGGLFYEYAPWEVEAHLSDAKIIEFKKYGVGHRIPHIKTIAATEDADFVISVLEKAYDEMNQRAKIFGNIGVSNLKSFRKKTGLAYPRVLIVMDEVESTFMLAGKQAGRIADLISGFARLGRAAGYHILMATQNMSSDIPKAATGQIRIRMCLGANEATSDAVLGNSGACENFGRIGKLIVNTDVLNGGDTYPSNFQYQTPFLTDDNFVDEMQELEELGTKIGYHPSLSFYDEEDIKTISTFTPVMDQALARMRRDNEITARQSPVILGYPAFVTNDADGLFKISFDHKDVENLVICSTKTEKVATHLYNIAYSLKDYWKIVHYSSDVDMFQYTPNTLTTSEVRDASAAPLNVLDAVVRKRLFVSLVDGLAKDEGSVIYDSKAIEQLFIKEGIPEKHWGNGLMYRRAAAFSLAASDPAFATSWNPVAPYFKSFAAYYKECVAHNAIIEPVSVEKFSKILYFIGDLSKIIGYGRDNSSKCVTPLKKLLQDCNRAGVVFVLYTRSMDGLNELNSGLRYAIFDTPDQRDWSRLRTDQPRAVSEKLAVLYDSLNTTNPQRKFKCTLIKEAF